MSATAASTTGMQVPRIWSSPFVNETIVALLLLQMVCAGFQPLKIFQIPVELMLLGILFGACMTFKYDRWQIAMLVVFCFVTAGSFFTTGSTVFLTALKHNALAVFALLYFSAVRFRSRLILPAFLLTVALLITSYLAPALVAPLIARSAFDEFNASRFGGLFLNAHFNAYFMAIALIYYGHKRRLYGLGTLLMYVTGSKVIFAAYVANLVAQWGPIRRVVEYPVVVVGAALLAAYLIFLNLEDLLDMLVNPQGVSAAIILLQLFDPAYYQPLLNPFPSGNIDVSGQAKVLFEVNDGHNEIGFFSLATVSGVFLGGLCLFLLLRYARPYRFLILVTLLHFGFVLNPLPVYMLITYSREIQASRMQKRAAKEGRTVANVPFATSARSA